MLPFDRHVQEMRDISRHLVRYSFPTASPEDEEIISCLKQREVTLDGYELVLYFNKCEYHDVSLETLQVFGKYFTFLPFSLICKAAYTFLGGKELSLIEVIHNMKGNTESIDQFSRKIYVWTVYYDQDGNPVPSPFASDARPQSYEGLKFSSVDKDKVIFF